MSNTSSLPRDCRPLPEYPSRLEHELSERGGGREGEREGGMEREREGEDI